MPEQRMDDYLDDIDAASDYWPEPTDSDDPTPPSFPEWNRRRAEAGRRPGTFTEYLAEIHGRFTADDAPDDRDWPAQPDED